MPFYGDKGAYRDNLVAQILAQQGMGAPQQQGLSDSSLQDAFGVDRSNMPLGPLSDRESPGAGEILPTQAPSADSLAYQGRNLQLPPALTQAPALSAMGPTSGLITDYDTPPTRNIGPYSGDPSPPAASGRITDYDTPPASGIPDWFQGGQSDWNRYVSNFAGMPGGRGDFNRLLGSLNVGGRYLFDPSGGGSVSDVLGGDVGGPPGGTGSPPGGAGVTHGEQPTGPLPGEGPTTSPWGGPAEKGGGSPFESGAPAITGSPSQSQGFFGGTPVGPGLSGAGTLTGQGSWMTDLMTPSQLENALSAFNQAAPEQGGFSTAGMSLSDLAEAWGVSIDSAAALAAAGFADLSGFGDESGGGPASGGDQGGGPGGGGAPGAGDDDEGY